MWMNHLVSELINMSLTASIIIVIVLIVRLGLKKAPKIFSYLLWSVVLFRLLCPVSFSSPLSLLGMVNPPVTESGNINYLPVAYAPSEPASSSPEYSPANAGTYNAADTSPLQSDKEPPSSLPGSPLTLASFVWLTGIGALLVVNMASYLRLRLKLVGAVRLRDNIYLSDGISSAFVMGFLSPKIYLPSNLSAEEQPYVILHEQTHIRRGDHIVKIIAFLALMLHWFNPLVWIAFVLSSNDMEMSCDESVIKNAGGDIRTFYSSILLRQASGRKKMAGAPLAFGKNATKGRIKNILRYQKPALWTVSIASIFLITLAVVLVSNPGKGQADVPQGGYQVKEILYDASQNAFAHPLEHIPVYLLRSDNLLLEKEPGGQWQTIGPLGPIPSSRSELARLFDPTASKVWDHISQATSIYRANQKEDSFYLVMQTRSGETLLAIGSSDAGTDHVQQVLRIEQICAQNQQDIGPAIEAYLGCTNVQVFSSSTPALGYLVAGYLCDGSEPQSDLGFASFREDQGRYLLLDFHVYPGAAKRGNRIYCAEDPAMLDTSYDVIFSCNEDLSSITQIRFGTQETVAQVTSSPSMTLFPSPKTTGAAESAYVFADQSGQQIASGHICHTNLAVLAGDTEWIPTWYEDGFDYDYDKIATLTIPSPQEEILLRANQVAELSVSEDYYQKAEGMTHVNRSAFTLQQNSEGLFSLPIPQSLQPGDSVVYFISYGKGIFVFRIELE